MKTDKVREALLDLQRQKEVLEGAIQSLRAVLESLKDTDSGPQPAMLPLKFGVAISKPKTVSYVEGAIRILTMAEKPLHITAICEQLRIMRGENKIKRHSVESTLIRYIQDKGQQAKIRKTGPGTYTLSYVTIERPTTAVTG